MQESTRYRRVLFGATLVALATSMGCGKGSGDPDPKMAPTNASQGEAQPPRTEEAVLGSIVPLGANEVAKVIDLRTFPRLEPAHLDQFRFGRVSYSAPASVDNAIDFYVKNLTGAGWREPPGERQTNKTSDDEYAQVYFEKQGFLLTTSFSKTPKGVIVSLSNSSNFDTRRLPRLPDAVSLPIGTKTFPIYTSDIYTTASPVEASVAFTSKEMRERGWQEFSPRLSTSKRVLGSLDFRNRAIRLSVYITVNQQKPHKTHVQYSAGVLSEDIPTLSDAANLQIEDKINFEMRFETAVKAQPIVDFYRKELPGLGWKIREGSGVVQNEQASLSCLGADEDSLLMTMKQGSGGKLLINFVRFPGKSKLPPETKSP